MVGKVQIIESHKACVVNSVNSICTKELSTETLDTSQQYAGDMLNIYVQLSTIP